MQASDIMTRNVITVRRDTLLDAVVRLLLMHRISAVPVVEDGMVVGIISEGDLLRRPETGDEGARRRWLDLLVSGEAAAAGYVRTHGITAEEIMTADVVSVSEATDINDIAEVMEAHGIKRVPVLRGDKLVGIVSRADLIRGLASRREAHPPQSDASIRAALLNELRRHSAWAPLSDEVRIVVRGGIVHYWGRVRSVSRRRAMVVMAERIAGVGQVRDHMLAWSEPEMLSRPKPVSPGHP